MSYRSVSVGEKFEYQVVISRLFDMTRAGNYTITCFKYLKNENREPGADLVGPKIVFKDIKIAVSEQDMI